MEENVGRILFLVVVLFVLIAGGALTAQYTSEGAQTLPLAKEQVSDVEGSVLHATPWQAQQFILLIGFLLVNLVGIALTLAVIMWFLNRQVTRVRAAEADVAASKKDLKPAS
jgi:hypothetical protein